MKKSVAKLSLMESSILPSILIFTKIVDHGSFIGAASEFGFTPSGISRILSRLEDTLGVKLFHRTTRHLSLTTEGTIFLNYARDLLAIEEAAQVELSEITGEARGHLRINCGTAFAKYKLAPILPKFLDMYPEISVDVSVCDYQINPIEEQMDITIRVGHLSDSDLIAIRIGTVKRIIAASPKYISANGAPKHSNDLKKHNCLCLTGFIGQATWPMLNNGEYIDIKVNGSVTSDNADVLLKMALEGVGIIRLGDFLGEQALKNGQLIELYKGKHDCDPKPLSVLVLPYRKSIPRIRAFIDFLKAESRS